MLRKEIIRAYTNRTLENPNPDQYDIQYANPKFFTKPRSSADYVYAPDNGDIFMAYVTSGKKIWRVEDHPSYRKGKGKHQLAALEAIEEPVETIEEEPVVVEQEEVIEAPTAIEEPTELTKEEILALDWDALREYVKEKRNSTVRSRAKAYELLGIGE